RRVLFRSEKPVEPCSRSRIAHAQVPLEVLHISARGEEDSKDLSVLVGQDAELARCERVRELGLAGRTGQPRHGEPGAADGTIRGRPASGGASHHPTSTRTSPMRQSMSRMHAPDPNVGSLTVSPSIAISPRVVRALIRLLDGLAIATRTSPILQRLALVPPSRRAEA